MGSDLGGSRPKNPRKAPGCDKVLWMGVLPFTLRLLLILALFKATPGTIHHR